MREAVKVGAIVVMVVFGGVVRPVFAQMDLAGEWGAVFHEDIAHRGGVELGDYTGIPINEAGFRKAASWDEAVVATHERQCIPHVATYALRGPATIRLSKVVDPDSGRLIAYNLQGSYGRPRTIWMDGRSHPSDLAPHTWTGFSTGTWDRQALAVTTTHIKMGWLQRNGVPTSDLATMKERFIRHGDQLMVVTIIDDPVFLSEPFIRTTNYVWSPLANANAWGSCGPAQIVDELPGRPKGHVPHHLPTVVSHIQEFLRRSGVPADAARGGGDTTSPDYLIRLQALGRGAPDPSLFMRPFPPPIGRVVTAAAAGDIRAVPVQGNVYLLAGAGTNIAVQIGDDGVLVVDSGTSANAEKVLAAIRQLSTRPVRFVVNTHAHPESVGGNPVLAKAGVPMGGGRAADVAVSIIAHESVLRALSAPSGGAAPMPVIAWPTDAYPGDSKEIFSNGEAIQVLHQPAAHTRGDSLVFFRRSDVVVTGHVYSLTSYPVIDAQNGGTFRGVLAAVNRIIELTIPKDWQEGGTLVVAGDGRIADEADVVEYRDMLTIVRDRVQDLVKRGMTLEQVRQARPTFEYDGRYGATSGPWTTDMFVEAVYRDVSGR